MKNRIIFPFIFMIIGITLAGMAVFADRIGLDPSTGWGKIRIALLIFGVATTVCSILYWRNPDKVLKVRRYLESFVEVRPTTSGDRGHHSIVYLSALLKEYWPVLPASILVLVIYIWLISSGTWTNWTSPTHYYADLTRGFLRGNLYLPINVSANLLNTPNPYEPLMSGIAQGPTDFSYYHGEYYLYWGPVPAVLLLSIHPIIHWRVGDLQLVFGFVTGLFLLQCLLAVMIWDRFFNNLPKYILWLSILSVGLASPATFILNNYKGARIYEAAISGGQFFLVGGFLAALSSLGRPASRWGLAAAGTLWSLAIGTRLNLALPIGFMALMVTGWILWISHWSFKKIIELIPLTLPLAFGLICLGWYNWARFGSITESGLFYQLPGAINLQKHYGELINPIYILQNLYNYFLNPFNIRAQFPYIYAESGSTKAIFSSYSLPAIYSAQAITGLLYSVPFIVFAIISPLAVLNTHLKRRVAQTAPKSDERPSLNWMILVLSGSCLAALGFLLTFFWNAMRYLEDVMPALIMLSVIGFWQGYKSLSNKPAWKRFYAAMGIILIAASILISTLVAISINDARFVIIRLFSSPR